MIKYDFRFNNSLISSFIGKTLVRYKHADFFYTNSITAILGFEIDNDVYALTNYYEKLDFFGLDNEATIFSLFKAEWNDIEPKINNDINENIVNETIQKILLVNDHTVLKVEQEVKYDMWETKAIIIYLKNREICFTKQDCWFSQEIEIYKGHDLLEKISDGKDILDDFDNDDSQIVSIERQLVEIK